MENKRATVTDLLEEIKLQLRVMERITATRPDMFEACTNINRTATEIAKWATDWCKFIEEERTSEIGA